MNLVKTITGHGHIQYKHIKQLGLMPTDKNEPHKEPLNYSTHAHTYTHTHTHTHRKNKVVTEGNQH